MVELSLSEEASRKFSLRFNGVIEGLGDELAAGQPPGLEVSAICRAPREGWMYGTVHAVMHMIYRSQMRRREMDEASSRAWS